MADRDGEVERLRAELQQLQARSADTQREIGALQRAQAAGDARETATADVLRIIASSPTDLQVVLETVVRSAMVLTGSRTAIISLREGDALRSVATAGEIPVGAEAAYVRHLAERTTNTRSFMEQRTIHVADRSDPAVHAEFPDLYRRAPEASVTVPLLRGSDAIGTLDVVRDRAVPYAAHEIALLETFADQAVIAIENARLFSDLQDANAQLAEASQHKSQFLANMSHELRTPLNAIIGYSEMLQEEAEDLGEDSLIPDLQKVNTAGKHLLGLINDILDLSKIEAGRMDLYLEDFEVGQVVRDVAAIVQPLMEKNGNTLVVTCPETIVSMHADLTKVRQTLFNLLSNAAKFTERGRIELRVNLTPPALLSSAERGEQADDRLPSPSQGGGVGGGGFLTFAITDTGIGMTEAQLSRLFEAFSQAEASTRSTYGGTGLGLAISRHFCRLMGGDLTVSSLCGQGSTFTVTLPTVVAEPAVATP